MIICKLLISWNFRNQSVIWSRAKSFLSPSMSLVHVCISTWSNTATGFISDGCCTWIEYHIRKLKLPLRWTYFERKWKTYWSSIFDLLVFQKYAFIVVCTKKLLLFLNVSAYLGCQDKKLRLKLYIVICRLVFHLSRLSI